MNQRTVMTLPESLRPEFAGITDDSYRTIKRFMIESGDKAFSAKGSERKNLKKTAADVTTAWDVQIELSFAKLVRELFPTHGFLGEEDPSLNQLSEYSWYIDAIDGTHYFATGVPLWSIAIALVHSGKPLIGLIYNPSTGDLYEAQQGCGAFLNGERLPGLSPTSVESRGRFIWDYVEWKGVPCQKLSQAEQLFYALRKFFDQHVTLVSGSLSLAFLSQGAFSAFIDPYRRKSKFVDIAAGLLVASEVGYEIHRQSLSDVAEEIIVAHPELVKAIRELLAKHMQESE